MMLWCPDYEPVTEVVVLPPETDITFSQAAQYPPIQKLPDGRLVVDMWGDGHGRVKYGKAWRRADHPNLKKLPTNAPRVVRAVFEANGQLAMLRGNFQMADAMNLYFEKLADKARSESQGETT